MKKKILAIVLTVLLVSVASAALAGTSIKMLVNGQELASDTAPVMENNRVLVPISFVAEALGCDVQWDKDNNAVVITKKTADQFLQGKNDPTQKEPSIHTNFIKAADLLAVLDDDNDGDVCDYRTGHNGGDSLANDPLVVDLREQADYDAGHIPGAIWTSHAQNAAQPENIAKLQDALKAHVDNGGKDEIVVYCYTSHTAGLAAGVLGAEGFNVKNMRFGYSIAWEGTRSADPTVFGAREDKDGNLVPYENAAKENAAK